MADLNSFIDQYRSMLLPEYQKLADQTTAAAGEQAKYYQGQEPSISQRYADELARLQGQQADETTSELGKVDANAAAAGAQGGVVTANRLMTSKAITGKYAPLTADVSTRKEDTLSKLRDTIAGILYGAKQKASDILMQGNQAVQSGAQNAYGQALDQEKFDKQMQLENRKLAEQIRSTNLSYNNNKQFKITPTVVSGANDILRTTKSDNPTDWDPNTGKSLDNTMSASEAQAALQRIQAMYGVDTDTAYEIFNQAFKAGGWQEYRPPATKTSVKSAPNNFRF